MTRPLEQSPAGGLGRLVLVAVLFGLLVPPPVFALPLAALLAVSRPPTRAERLVAVFAGALSLAWLMAPGELPEQVLRASLVISTAMFVILTLAGRLSFIHRALVSIGVAAAGIVVLFLAFGWSWDQLHWWVTTERSYEMSRALAALRASPSSTAMAASLQPLLEQSVRFEASNYPALCALKLLPGLAIATALYHRLATAPRGQPLGRFREFRFTEHLGWAAAIPLLIIVLPGLVRAKVAATNLLLLTGTLYALRGAAVAAFMVGLAGTGPLGVMLGLLAVLFMLPVVLGIGILLGVLDTGMDLRRRWSKPPARN